VGKKKFAKEIKRVKRKAKEAKAEKLILEKSIRKLTKKLHARKQQVADLQDKLNQTRPTSEPTQSPTAEWGDRGETRIASHQRSAWKQHRYLRDRYELHLGAGETREHARHLANEDLKQEYGSGYGYTEEELSAILS
jgi:predicted RNase H-like nuclease (RuvC/YqgF family)